MTVGCGEGVGVTGGRGVAVGVVSGRITGRGVAVGVGVGLGVGSGVGVGLGLGVSVGSGSGVGVGLGVGEGLGVGVGTVLGVGAGVGVGVGTGEGLGVGAGFFPQPVRRPQSISIHRARHRPRTIIVFLFISFPRLFAPVDSVRLIICGRRIQGIERREKVPLRRVVRQLQHVPRNGQGGGLQGCALPAVADQHV